MKGFSIILSTFNIAFASFEIQKWTYIYEVPSQQWKISDYSKDTFWCAFELLHSHLVKTRLGKDSNICEKETSDIFLPEYYYFVKVVRFTEEQTQDGRREKVQHYLPQKAMVGDRFHFVIQKYAENRFSITFKSIEDVKMLSVTDTSTAFKLGDSLENDSWVEVESQIYPFTNLREYDIGFEVFADYWQIYIDGDAFITFDHVKPYSDVEKIQVLTYSNITYKNKVDVYAP
ncbi:uncharacterized protein LOC132722197 [Ruditapes philippinarum]|uniref:uncharacterized protein LOC132722197 n=1 Tax=Ruditapes philippinarum TaxID=129788 RepID=UPI00295A5D57|nr:uncharacterized protein LOC132722197 [Ruditapes philippinarum]